MPLPRWITRFNRMANRVFGPLAAYLPGFGVIVHTGRKTGRQYRTPVKIFSRSGGYVIALVYGRESDWVRNVLAFGGCVLATRGRALRLTGPRLVHDARHPAAPALLRLIGRLGLASDFLDCNLEPRGSRSSARLAAD